MESFFKFYRFKHISNPSQNLSRDLLLRVGYPKLAMSSVIFLKLNTSFFVFFSFQDYRILARSVLMLSNLDLSTKVNKTNLLPKFYLTTDLAFLFYLSF